MKDSNETIGRNRQGKDNVLKDIVGETWMIYRRICKDSRGFEQIHKARLYISYESCMYIDMQRYAKRYRAIQQYTRTYKETCQDIQGCTGHDVHAYIYTKIRKDIHRPKLVGAFV